MIWDDIHMISRLKRYCAKNGYQIVTRDPRAQKLADDTLKVKIGENIDDLYKITKIFNGSNADVTKGSLIEIIHDLGLLGNSESVDLSEPMELGDQFKYRRLNVRLPWDRT